MSFSDDHARALADVKDNGAAVTCSLTDNSANYNPTTGVTVPAVTTVAGQAMRVPGDPRKYEALGLVEMQALSLLFVATTFGDTPSLDMELAFGGERFRIKHVEPLAIDGTTILSNLVVAR